MFNEYFVIALFVLMGAVMIVRIMDPNHTDDEEPALILVAVLALIMAILFMARLVNGV